MAVLDRLVHELVRGLGTALESHREGDAGGAAGLDHGVGVGEAERHRLLDQDVFAGAGGGDRLAGMLPARRADADGIHVRPGEERLVARLAGHAELGGGGGGLRRIEPRDGDEPRPGRGRDGLRVIARDHAGAEDGDAKRLGH